jgi:hypothetical protein
MEFPEFTPEERDRILTAAARLKSLRGDPAATLIEAARAQQWVLQQVGEPQGFFFSPAQIAQLLRQGLPILQLTPPTDPLDCPMVRHSLRFHRLARYMGQPSEGDQAMDEVADLVGMRQEGPGRPRRPFFRNFGDSRDWILFRRMTGWFRRAGQILPKDIKREEEILQRLRISAKNQIPDLEDARLPGLAHCLALYRNRRGRGEISAKEATALWFTGRKPGFPPDDVEAAVKEVERLRKQAGRAAERPGQKTRT